MPRPGHNEPNAGHPLVELRRDSRSLVAVTLRPDLKVAEVAISLRLQEPLSSLCLITLKSAKNDAAMNPKRITSFTFNRRAVKRVSNRI